MLIRGYRFQQGMHIFFRGREYLIEECLPGGDIQIKDIATNEFQSLPEQLLVEALFEGTVEFLAKWQTNLFTQQKSIISDFTVLPENLRAEAKRRYAYVKQIKGYNLDKVTETTLIPLIRLVSKTINDVAPPSWITLYRWFKKYNESGEDIRSLVPSTNMKGNRSRKIDSRIIEIINDTITEKYLSRERPTVQSVYNLIVARIARDNEFKFANSQLDYPDRSTVYNIVNKLDPYSKTLGRYGKKIADQKHMAVKEGPRPTRVLERVEIDHTKLDLFVIDEKRKMPIGRPWFTTATDVYSKVTVGIYLSFNPPSYLSVMQCLRHAIMPKVYVRNSYPSIKHKWDTYGIPETVAVDNAKEFTSTHFEDACLQLGISIEYAPPQLAWYKATVERYFGSLNTQLLHEQPGTTFSNIFERADYDPAKNAVISFEVLVEIVHKWIVDIYHQQEHRGIMDIPSRVWEKGVAQYPPALPSRGTDIEILLGQVAQRRITSSGIELHGLLYNDEKLILLRQAMKPGQKAIIKYNPTDLSIAYVFDPLRGNFIAVPALSQEYTKDLTLWQHGVIKNYARQYVKNYVDIVALSQAKEEIQQIVNREWKAAGRKSTRQRLARWENQSQKITNSDLQLQERTNICEYVQDSSSAELIKLDPRDNPLAGISNLDSAFSTPKLNQPNTQLASGYVEDCPTLKLPKSVKRTRRLKKSEQKDEQIRKEVSKCVEENNLGASSEEKFDMDLTGWSADYNLPK